MIFFTTESWTETFSAFTLGWHNCYLAISNLNIRTFHAFKHIGFCPVAECVHQISNPRTVSLGYFNVVEQLWITIWMDYPAFRKR